MLQFDFILIEWVESRDFSLAPKEGHVMQKVDTIVCVVCGKKQFSLSTGKSARVQNGVCTEHQKELVDVSQPVRGVVDETSEAKSARKS